MPRVRVDAEADVSIGDIPSAILPSILFICALAILRSDKGAFDAFLDGAADGMRTTAKLLPSLCALIVATSMLFASGLADDIASSLSGVFGAVGLPSEITPLLLTRPISGSASMASFSELLSRCGPDSGASLVASVIMGSSDTVIYVLSVYFSSVNVKRTRHAFPVALIAMIFCIFASSLVCRLFFDI